MTTIERLNEVLVVATGDDGGDGDGVGEEEENKLG